MDSDGNSGIQLEFLVAPWPRAQPVKGGPDRIRAVTKVVPHFVEGKSEANGTGISMIFLNVKWEETWRNKGSGMFIRCFLRINIYFHMF